MKSAENVQRSTFNAQGSTQRISAALANATATLLAEAGPDGTWHGELSSSALSTATAVVALTTLTSGQSDEALIHNGLRWLAEHQNADGGWGDTTVSKSNISTTALAWAAFGASGADHHFASTVARAERWLEVDHEPGDDRDRLVAAIEARYGKDRTFSVPILMTLAISGRLGAHGWQRVIALPFELAALPHQLFGALQLPVVSYAMPALIAIGQAVHHHAPSRNPAARWIRELSTTRTLRVLERIQPANGGFLEATPLTSFVTMSIASMGAATHPVAERGAAFLRSSVRPDGSWPIDTNLATWLTTLSLKALRHTGAVLTPEKRQTLRAWLLAQQFKEEHPYTHAAPGGWAWTDLPGGVPDADDTAGALIALLECGVVDGPTCQAGIAGVGWLLDLQNRDGGIPTFCRGWGALPFDRSGSDLTAHALRAWSAWQVQLPDGMKRRVDRAIARGVRYLQTAQRSDGTWLPLWFGNEHEPDEENPTYGTAHVLMALRELHARGFSVPPSMIERSAQWLANAQSESGGWGGFTGAPASVEETGAALEALAGLNSAAVKRGATWLAAQVENGTWREPAPIGFYFAKLWYSERLYPLIFTVGGLAAAAADEND